MLTKLKHLKALLGLAWAFQAHAALKVVTTTEDLASLVKTIGGDGVEVTSIARGTQDPHFVEAKPSYMVKLARADLVIAYGLQLEIGWLPLLLRGARQPGILPGKPGYLEVADAISPLEVKVDADRKDGDVHPQGNPHFMADPERGRLVAALIAKRLGELTPEKAPQFSTALKAWDARLVEKIKSWKSRLAKLKGTKILGYHKTFNYFAQFFGLEMVGYIEPKPGIPPTAGHVLSLIDSAKKAGVKLVLIENYFDMKAARSICDQTGAKLIILPAYTGGDDKSSTYEDWLEQLVKGIEEGHLSSK